MQPSDIDAEMSVLGCVILGPSCLDDLLTLRATHFFDPVNGRLYGGIIERHADGKPIDPISISKAFESDAGLKSVGGTGYLARLCNDACDESVVGEYAKIITDLAARRAIIVACQSGIDRAINIEIGDSQQAVKIAAEVETALQRIESASAVGVGVFAGAASQEYLTHLIGVVDGTAPPGLTFGVDEIDKMLGPVGVNDVIILGGRTSMGKSAVAQQLAQKIAEQGRGVAFFAMEMSSEQMSARLMASYATKPLAYTDINRGNINAYDLDAIKSASSRISKLPIIFDHRGGLKPLEVIAACRKFKRNFEAQGVPMGLIVLDHIGLMGSDEKTAGDYARMSSVARQLKHIAKALGCAVMACTQINREGEKRDGSRPTRADLRDSGHIEEIADAIILCYRKAYYTKRSPPDRDDGPDKYDDWVARLEKEKNQLELIFDKVRMGETGSVTVWFDPATTRLCSLTNPTPRLT